MHCSLCAVAGLEADGTFSARAVYMLLYCDQANPDNACLETRNVFLEIYQTSHATIVPLMSDTALWSDHCGEVAVCLIEVVDWCLLYR